VVNKTTSRRITDLRGTAYRELVGVHKAIVNNLYEFVGKQISSEGKADPAIA